MTIRFNPMEYIDDLVAIGYTRSLACTMAREEVAKRHKRDTDQLKVDNDYAINRGGKYVRVHR